MRCAPVGSLVVVVVTVVVVAPMVVVHGPETAAYLAGWMVRRVHVDVRRTARIALIISAKPAAPGRSPVQRWHLEEAMTSAAVSVPVMVAGLVAGQG